MIRYFILVFVIQFIGGLIAYETELIVGNNKGTIAILLLISIIILFFILWWINPKARIQHLVYQKLEADKKLPYRGLITVVSPILLDKKDDGQIKRKNKIESLNKVKDENLLDVVKLGFNHETKQFATIINIAERCKNLKYIWLITTDSKAFDKSKTPVNAMDEAKILARVLKKINKNKEVKVFMGTDIRLKIPKDSLSPFTKIRVYTRYFFIKLLRGIFSKNDERKLLNLHFANDVVWSPDIIQTVLEQVDKIYEKHLPLLGLRDKDILAQPMNGLKQISNGMLLAALPDNRDITLSIKDDQKGSIDTLYKFKAIARIKEG